MATRRNERIDHQKGHRQSYERNKAKLIKYGKANDIPCAICNYPIDYSLRYPNPMAVTVDHIIPISRNGHPTDMNNLQLAHFRCNIVKADNLPTFKLKMDQGDIASDDLPLSIDWSKYEANNQKNNDKLAKDVELLRTKGYSLYIDGIMPTKN